MSTPLITDAYVLRKRIRNEEPDYYPIRRPPSWTKSILDLNNDKYLTRTPFNWLRLLVFYSLFFSGLCIFYAINMTVFFENLDKNVPRLLMKQPGFSLTPCLIHDGECAISYRLSRETEYFAYSDIINQTLQKFIDEDTEKYFGPCQWENEYGYEKGAPCVFLKVNTIIGFQPLSYKNAEDLPSSAPMELDKLVTDGENKIWLTCETSTLEVNISYYPARFIRSEAVYLKKKVIKRDKFQKTIHENGEHVALNEDKIFYDKQDLERMVAVQLTHFPKDVPVQMSCYLWASNIERIDEGQFNKGRIRVLITVRP